jgi:hypothetical protein
VVLGTTVVLPCTRLKQVVASGQLKRHASGGPDVGGGVVVGADEDFEGPVLPGLDVVGEPVERNMVKNSESFIHNQHPWTMDYGGQFSLSSHLLTLSNPISLAVLSIDI